MNLKSTLLLSYYDFIKPPRYQYVSKPNQSILQSPIIFISFYLRIIINISIIIITYLLHRIYYFYSIIIILHLYYMNQIIKQLTQLKQLFKSPSPQVSNALYPFCTFIIGALYASNKSFKIDQLKQFIQTLESLVQRKKIDQNHQKILLQAIQKEPNFLQKIISNILDPIDNGKNIKILQQISKINNCGTIIEQQIKSQHTQQVANSEDTILFDQGQQNIQKKKKQQQQQRQSLLLIKQLEKQDACRSDKNHQDGAQCEICLDSLYQSKFIPLDGCGHVFHVQCIKQSFRNFITQRKFPLVCPKQGCNNQIKDSDIKETVGLSLYQQYMEITFKNYVDLNNDTVSWCPTADCKYVFFYGDQDQPKFQCQQCKKEYCLKCRSDWHKNMTCKQYQISSTFNEDDQKFLNFVKGAKFKQCPKCKFWVQKNMGCDHMSCRCGNQFCYKCGGKYGDCQCVREIRQRQRQLRQKNQARQRKRAQNAQKKRLKLLEASEIQKPSTRSSKRR